MKFLFLFSDWSARAKILALALCVAAFCIVSVPARAAVLVSDSPLALTDEGVLPPGEETAAPPTADQISLIQIMVVVVAVVVLLGFLWFGLNERHRFHQRHHHRREKRRKLFDFLELKK